MNVLSLSEYKVILAERICHEKFENDIMLLFNNFTEEAVYTITDMVKSDIRDIEDKGVIFDPRLLNIHCTMYLGIAWSMYRKGKAIQRKNRLMNFTNEMNYRENPVDKIMLVLSQDKCCIQTVEDIASRYYTLYLGRHMDDIIDRMEVGNHRDSVTKEILINIFNNYLKEFSVRTMAIGIYDEYSKYCN